MDKVVNASLYDTLKKGITEWIAHLGLDRGGFICSSQTGDWFLLCPVGFDLTTVRRFVIPHTTMSSVVSVTETWHTLKGKDLQPFIGFFSSREAEGLKAIHVINLSFDKEPRILAFLAESDLSRTRTVLSPTVTDEQAVDRLRSLATGARSVLSLLLPGPKADNGPFEEKIKSRIEAGMSAELLSLSLEKALGQSDSIASDPELSGIFQAIVSRIKKKAGNSNIVHVSEDFTIQVILFSANTLDADMYVSQLFSPLERAFGIPRIANISIDFKGRTDSLQEILAFVTGRA